MSAASTWSPGCGPVTTTGASGTRASRTCWTGCRSGLDPNGTPGGQLSISVPEQRGGEHGARSGPSAPVTGSLGGDDGDDGTDRGRRHSLDAEDDMTNELTQPFTYHRGVVAANRIMMAPMVAQASDEQTRKVHADDLAFYGLRSGAAGTIVSGAMNVTDRGWGFDRGLSIDSDDCLPGLTELAIDMMMDITDVI